MATGTKKAAVTAAPNKTEVTADQAVQGPNGEAVENKRANYNKLVRTARLRFVTLENIEFKILPEVLAPENRDLLKREVDARTKVLRSGSEGGTCIANITWSIDSKLNKRRVVRCRASYVISYDGMKDCSEDTIGVFIDNVGKQATYAYLRSLYANLDWAANLGSSPLPIIQFLPKL